MGTPATVSSAGNDLNCYWLCACDAHAHLIQSNLLTTDHLAPQGEDPKAVVGCEEQETGCETQSSSIVLATTIHNESEPVASEKKSDDENKENGSSQGGVMNHISTCQNQLQETGAVLNQILDQLVSSRKSVQEKMQNKENSAESGKITLAEIQKKKEELLSGLQNNLTLQSITQNQQRKLVGKDQRESKPAVRNNMFLLQQKRFKETNINEMVNLSIRAIKYGSVISGNIFEEDLEISNKQIDSLVLKILVQCHNQEFDDHDEYVFSVRKTCNYDYNEKFVVIIPPLKSHLFKIAMKVPNIKD